MEHRGFETILSVLLLMMVGLVVVMVVEFFRTRPAAAAPEWTVGEAGATMVVGAEDGVTDEIHIQIGRHDYVMLDEPEDWVVLQYAPGNPYAPATLRLLAASESVVNPHETLPR